MADARRDNNYITTQLGVSNVDGTTPVDIYADPTTHRLLTQSTISGSVAITNGLSISAYDYVSMTLSAGNTTETYTFKSGGSGGTTVATVVVVYTDSTRTVLSSVTKT